MAGNNESDSMEPVAAQIDPSHEVESLEDAAIYRPEVFSVSDMAQAKAIILTPDDGLTTDFRWETETLHLVEMIGAACNLNEQSVVLDYGCGVGRMSKALIERYGCTVVGVDISYSMRQLALSYVMDERFSVVSHWVLGQLQAKGLKFDCCIAIWVLQHCPEVASDISFIKSLLKDQGLLYVLNTKQTCIPSNKGWVNDGVDVKALLESAFSLQEQASLPLAATTPYMSEITFVALLKNDKPAV